MPTCKICNQEVSDTDAAVFLGYPVHRDHDISHAIAHFSALRVEAIERRYIGCENCVFSYPGCRDCVEDAP
jgi:CO dehydrogenase/acetyl-CoA synthase epsilon subunit